MNPMEGEAFCLPGHFALSWLARAGSGRVWVSGPAMWALQKGQAARTSTKPVNTRITARVLVLMDMQSLSWVSPVGWTWKHRRA